MALCDCAWNMLLRNVVETWADAAGSPNQGAEQSSRPLDGVDDGARASSGVCLRQRRVRQLLVFGSVVVSVRPLAGKGAKGGEGGGRGSGERGGGVVGADDAVVRAALGRLAARSISLRDERTGAAAASTAGREEGSEESGGAATAVIFDAYGTSAPRALPCGTTHQNVRMRW